jgi:hypothetical protein
MSKHVWVACGMGSPVNNKQLRSNFSSINLEVAAERQVLNEKGELLPKDFF